VGPESVAKQPRGPTPLRLGLAGAIPSLAAPPLKRRGSWPYSSSPRAGRAVRMCSAIIFYHTKPQRAQRSGCSPPAFFVPLCLCVTSYLVSFAPASAILKSPTPLRLGLAGATPSLAAPLLKEEGVLALFFPATRYPTQLYRHIVLDTASKTIVQKWLNEDRSGSYC
jgi:hypothetical protein